MLASLPTPCIRATHWTIFRTCVCPRGITYSCEPAELSTVLEAWFEAAPADPSHGWTRTELEAHVRNEHSTFTWLLEPMLERAGFRIHEVWQSDSRTYAQYLCTRA